MVNLWSNRAAQPKVHAFLSAILNKAQQSQAKKNSLYSKNVERFKKSINPSKHEMDIVLMCFLMMKDLLDFSFLIGDYPRRDISAKIDIIARCLDCSPDDVRFCPYDGPSPKIMRLGILDQNLNFNRDYTDFFEGRCDTVLGNDFFQ